MNDIFIPACRPYTTTQQAVVFAIMLMHEEPEANTHEAVMQVIRRVSMLFKPEDFSTVNVEGVAAYIKERFPLRFPTIDSQGASNE